MISIESLVIVSGRTMEITSKDSTLYKMKESKRGKVASDKRHKRTISNISDFLGSTEPILPTCTETSKEPILDSMKSSKPATIKFIKDEETTLFGIPSKPPTSSKHRSKHPCNVDLKYSSHVREKEKASMKKRKDIEDDTQSRKSSCVSISEHVKQKKQKEHTDSLSKYLQKLNNDNKCLGSNHISIASDENTETSDEDEDDLPIAQLCPSKREKKHNYSEIHSGNLAEKRSKFCDSSESESESDADSEQQKYKGEMKFNEFEFKKRQEEGKLSSRTSDTSITSQQKSNLLFEDFPSKPMSKLNTPLPSTSTLQATFIGEGTYTKSSISSSTVVLDCMTKCEPPAHSEKIDINADLFTSDKKKDKHSCDIDEKTSKKNNSKAEIVKKKKSKSHNDVDKVIENSLNYARKCDSHSIKFESTSSNVILNGNDAIGIDIVKKRKDYSDFRSKSNSEASSKIQSEMMDSKTHNLVLESVTLKQSSLKCAASKHHSKTDNRSVGPPQSLSVKKKSSSVLPTDTSQVLKQPSKSSFLVSTQTSSKIKVHSNKSDDCVKSKGSKTMSSKNCNDMKYHQPTDSSKLISNSCNKNSSIASCNRDSLKLKSKLEENKMFLHDNQQRKILETKEKVHGNHPHESRKSAESLPTNPSKLSKLQASYSHQPVVHEHIIDCTPKSDKSKVKSVSSAPLTSAKREHPDEHHLDSHRRKKFKSESIGLYENHEMKFKPRKFSESSESQSSTGCNVKNEKPLDLNVKDNFSSVDEKRGKSSDSKDRHHRVKTKTHDTDSSVYTESKAKSRKSSESSDHFITPPSDQKVKPTRSCESFQKYKDRNIHHNLKEKSLVTSTDLSALSDKDSFLTCPGKTKNKSHKKVLLNECSKIYKTEVKCEISRTLSNVKLHSENSINSYSKLQASNTTIQELIPSNVKTANDLDNKALLSDSLKQSISESQVYVETSEFKEDTDKDNVPPDSILSTPTRLFSDKVNAAAKTSLLNSPIILPKESSSNKPTSFPSECNHINVDDEFNANDESKRQWHSSDGKTRKREDKKRDQYESKSPKECFPQLAITSCKFSTDNRDSDKVVSSENENSKMTISSKDMNTSSLYVSKSLDPLESKPDCKPYLNVKLDTHLKESTAQRKHESSQPKSSLSDKDDQTQKKVNRFKDVDLNFKVGLNNVALRLEGEIERAKRKKRKRDKEAKEKHRDAKRKHLVNIALAASHTLIADQSEESPSKCVTAISKAILASSCDVMSSFEKPFTKTNTLSNIGENLSKEVNENHALVHLESETSPRAPHELLDRDISKEPTHLPQNMPLANRAAALGDSIASISEILDTSSNLLIMDSPENDSLVDLNTFSMTNSKTDSEERTKTEVEENPEQELPVIGIDQSETKDNADSVSDTIAMPSVIGKSTISPSISNSACQLDVSDTNIQNATESGRINDQCEVRTKALLPTDDVNKDVCKAEKSVDPHSEYISSF